MSDRTPILPAAKMDAIVAQASEQMTSHLSTSERFEAGRLAIAVHEATARFNARLGNRYSPAERTRIVEAGVAAYLASFRDAAAANGGTL